MQRAHWLEPLDNMLYGMFRPLRMLDRWRKRRRRRALKSKKPEAETGNPASETSCSSTASSSSIESPSSTLSSSIDIHSEPSPALLEAHPTVSDDDHRPLRRARSAPDVLPSPRLSKPSPAPAASPTTPAPARAPPPKHLRRIPRPPWDARFASRCRRAEGGTGIGDEMLFCLQRGPAGPRSWGRFADLDGAVAQLRAQQLARLADDRKDARSGAEPPRRLRVDVVFAGKDCLVGRDAAAWFRRLWDGGEAWVDFAAKTDEEGEHNTLLGPRGHLAWLMMEAGDLWEGK